MDTGRIAELIIQAVGTLGAVGALVALFKFKAENDKIRAEAHRIRRDAARIDQEADKVHQEAIQLEVARLTKMAEFYFQKWQECQAQADQLKGADEE